MLKVHTRTSSIIAIAIFALGCNSTTKNDTEAINVNIPQWVLNPAIEKGLASSSCVIASNSYSMDKLEVATQARSELASQIETRVSGLHEDYATKTTSLGRTITESKISISLTQLTDQYLRGSDVVKVEYIQIGKVKNLCAMVTLSQNKTKGLFNQLLNKTPFKLNQENESALYSNFIKSGKATK